MPVLAMLFALIFIMTVVEAAVLIGVGGVIGLWPTLALIFLTAFAGAHLLRQQGLSTLLRARQRLEMGEIPAAEMAEGIILAIGGALLLTPGFITDGIGLICLLPFTRHLMVRKFAGKIQVINLRGQGGAPFGAGQESPFTQDQGSPFTHEQTPQPGSSRRPDTIEGEYKREE